MSKRKKLWSKVVEQHGQKVRIYEKRRGAPLWISVVVGRAVSEAGKSYPVMDRRPLGHKDRALAEHQAYALADEIADRTLKGRMPEELTLGQLFAQYRIHRLFELTPRRQREAGTRMSMFIECWGRKQQVGDLTQGDLNTYIRKRRTLELLPPALKEREDGSRPKGYRTPQPPRDGALHGELSALSTICNWATRHKVNGKPLLADNPLRGLELPRERNPRRPVASHARYLATQEHADGIDPAGRLRCILALARFTGRRADAICRLRANDVLRTTERVAEALAGAGMNENLADHYAHGAIRWSAETDKEGFLFITPIGAPARAALDEYQRRSPRLGDVALFPAPGRDGPISFERASTWLRRAERAAGMPKLRGGLWHAYRRLWASERKHLPDRVVAEAGGWRDTRALKTSYQAAEAREIAAAVNLDP